MKRFYNQEIKKLEEKNDGYKVFQYELDIPSSYGLNYYRILDESMREFFAAIEPTNEAVLFQIRGDFSLLKSLKDEDKLYYILAVTNIFASHLFTKKMLKTEYRLTPPKAIESVKLNNMVKKDMTNKLMKYPMVSIEIIDTNNDIVYEVM